MKTQMAHYQQRLEYLKQVIRNIQSFGYAEIDLGIHCVCHVMGIGTPIPLPGQLITVPFCVATSNWLQEIIEAWAENHAVRLFYDCPFGQYCNEINLV